jgi:hypothetical protein
MPERPPQRLITTVHYHHRWPAYALVGVAPADAADASVTLGLAWGSNGSSCRSRQQRRQSDPQSHQTKCHACDSQIGAHSRFLLTVRMTVRPDCAVTQGTADALISGGRTDPVTARPAGGSRPQESRPVRGFCSHRRCGCASLKSAMLNRNTGANKRVTATNPAPWPRPLYSGT